MGIRTRCDDRGDALGALGDTLWLRRADRAGQWRRRATVRGWSLDHPRSCAQTRGRCGCVADVLAHQRGAVPRGPRTGWGWPVVSRAADYSDGLFRLGWEAHDLARTNRS